MTTEENKEATVNGTTETAKVDESETVEKKDKNQDLLDQIETWKRHARDWEEKAKTNKTQLEEKAFAIGAKDDELRGLTEKVEAMEETLVKAQKVALVNRVAAEYGVSADDADLFLTADDEDKLRRQAEALASRSSDAAQKASKPVIPNLHSRKTDGSSTSDEELINRLFNL